jgi:hypothetical protein
MKATDNELVVSTLTLKSQVAFLLLPAFTVAFGNDWPWEVVSSYSSATAPELHGISRADPHFETH